MSDLSPLRGKSGSRISGPAGPLMNPYETFDRLDLRRKSAYALVERNGSGDRQ